MATVRLVPVRGETQSAGARAGLRITAMICADPNMGHQGGSCPITIPSTTSLLQRFVQVFVFLSRRYPSDLYGVFDQPPNNAAV